MARNQFLSWRISKRFIAILLLSILHFFGSSAVFWFAFSRGMARFDNGGPPTFAERVADVAANILWFPMYLRGPFSQVVQFGNGWPVLIANSVLWGIGLCYMCEYIGKRLSTRFSLKTAMIVLTVVAIALALLYQLR